ncbi:hypothetical protein pb186bvf_007228 [Paramecium bursaria]
MIITLISLFIISLNQSNQLYDQFNFIDRQSLIHYYIKLSKNDPITTTYLINSQSLEQLEVKYSFENYQFQIISDNQVLVSLKQSDDRQIVQVGTISQLDDLLQKYPTDKFQYYGLYNNLNPMKIIINRWNRGIRVSFPEFYPQGNDGSTLKFGTDVFTKDTDDTESKGQYYHRYYDFQMNVLNITASNNLNILIQRI